MVFGNDTAYSTWTHDIFIAKLDSSGSILWKCIGTGDAGDVAYSMTSDSVGNIYVTGKFSSNDLTIGSLTRTNTWPPGYDVFLTKIDSAGNALWLTSAIGGGNEEGTSVSLDNLGNAYLTGFYGNGCNISFDGFQISGCNEGSFIVKYNSLGVAQWAISPVSTDGIQGMGIHYNNITSRVDVTGNFYNGIMNMGSITLYNSGLGDFFITEISDSPVGVFTLSQNERFRIFPNPVTSNLQVSKINTSRNATVEIYNTLSEKIYENNLTDFLNIDCSRWIPGIYVITITSETEHYIQKLVKK